MDSNHDSQIQSLESYQLDDPGAVENFGLTLCSRHNMWVNRGKISSFGTKLDGRMGHSREFVLHEIRPNMRIAIDHFLATVSDPFLENPNRRSRQDRLLGDA
jgi:hypothetical protein